KTSFLVWICIFQMFLDLIGSDDPLAQPVARTAQIVERPVQIINNTQRLDGAATVRDLSVRTSCVKVWHRPDRLIHSPCPHCLTARVIRVAHTVNFSRVYNRLLRSTDFSNVFVPYIGNTLFRNQPRRVGNGFVFGMGNPLANARTGPCSRERVGQNVSDPLHKRERVSFRVNAAGKLVQLNSSLPVTFVFQLGALHRCLLVRCGSALLWISESKSEY